MIDSLGPSIVQPQILYIIELQRRLSYWIDWLYSSHYLAFGDDPGPVFDIERELSAMIQQIDRLRPIIEQPWTETERVLTYRAAREQLYSASDFVVRVRELDCGSTEFTSKLRQLLLECRAYLKTMKDDSQYTVVSVG